MTIPLGLTGPEFERHYAQLKQQEALIMWQSITSQKT